MAPGLHGYSGIMVTWKTRTTRRERDPGNGDIPEEN